MFHGIYGARATYGSPKLERPWLVSGWLLACALAAGLVMLSGCAPEAELKSDKFYAHRDNGGTYIVYGADGGLVGLMIPTDGSWRFISGRTHDNTNEL